MKYLLLGFSWALLIAMCNLVFWSTGYEYARGSSLGSLMYLCCVITVFTIAVPVAFFDRNNKEK